MGFLIDSHCHIQDEKFDVDRDQILSSLRENNILSVIIPSDTLESSRRALEIAESSDIPMYCTVGVHPHESQMFDKEAERELCTMLSHRKVIAVGEIGLDYHYDFSPREIQKDVFSRQMMLAKKENLPVVIHTREAIADTFDILNSFRGQVIGVMHSYTGSWEMAKRFLDLGYYISISGIVTFKNAHHVQEMVKNIPLDRLLVETDAPYMTPHPFRGKRNEPKYVHYTAQKIAELKQVPVSQIEEVTRKNTLKLFLDHD